MVTQVRKRDGCIVGFDEDKIYSAISYAYLDVYKELDEDKEEEISDITEEVVELLSECDAVIGVESIQDIVEQIISEHDFHVAKSYITYRYKRRLARDDYNAIMNMVADKLGAKNVENQNANVDERSFGGRIGSMASAVAKYYALNYLMSAMAKVNHEGNMIYVHDLDHYAVGDHNCLSCPIDKLLAEGFNTRQCDVRPAKSVNTAFQLVAVIFQIQSLQQFGGVSATHLDWSMLPYVRLSFYKHFCDGMEYSEMKDIFAPTENIRDVSIEDKRYKEYPKAYQYAIEMTTKETYQAVEGMYHNLKVIRAA